VSILSTPQGVMTDTSAKTDAEARALLEAFQFPFTN